jgi:hypothetical protein
MMKDVRIGWTLGRAGEIPLGQAPWVNEEK